MTAHTPLNSNGITAIQINVESLFAVLALGAIVVFGLRHASALGPEFQNLALLRIGISRDGKPKAIVTMPVHGGGA